MKVIVCFCDLLCSKWDGLMKCFLEVFFGENVRDFVEIYNKYIMLKIYLKVKSIQF